MNSESNDPLQIALRRNRSALTRPNDNGASLAKAADESKIVRDVAKKIAFEHQMDADIVRNELISAIWQAQTPHVTLTKFSPSVIKSYVMQIGINLANHHYVSPHHNEIPIEYLEERPDTRSHIAETENRLEQNEVAARIKAKIIAARARMNEDIPHQEPEPTSPEKPFGRPKNQSSSVVAERRDPSQSEMYELYKKSLLELKQYAVALETSQWLLRKYFDGIRPVPEEMLSKARQYDQKIEPLRSTMAHLQNQPMDVIVDRWKRMRQPFFSNVEIANIIGVSRTTVFRWSQPHGQQRPTPVQMAEYERKIIAFNVSSKKNIPQ